MHVICMPIDDEDVGDAGRGLASVGNPVAAEAGQRWDIEVKERR